MSTPIRIKYLSAHCGAGKTYALIRHAGRLADLGRKVMIVQPTSALIDETLSSMVPEANLSTTPTRIDGTTHPNKVIHSINDHLSTANNRPGGEMVFVTHSAFFALPHFKGRPNWTIIIDEIPAIERHFQLNIPKSHSILTDHIKVADRSDHRYWRIEPEGSRLREIARNPDKDQVLKLFEEFAAATTSPHWQVFAHAQRYQSLIEKRDAVGVSRQLVASAIMAPDVFAHFHDVIIAGAFFEQSLLHLLWSRWGSRDHDVRFEDVRETYSLPLRYDSHTNGDLIDLYYGMRPPLSKNFRSKAVKLKTGGEAPVFEALVASAREIIGSDRVAEFFNADVKAPLFENGERLPNVSHGLNSYTDIDHCVLLAAHNPPSAHFDFLRKFAEIEPEEVHDALTHQNCYQALNRTSVRDPKNTNAKKVFVADEGTARFLRRAFMSSDGTKAPRLHYLDLFADDENLGKVGRRRKHQNGAERSADYRARKARREEEVAIRLARIDIVEGMPNIFDGAKALAYERARSQLADRELINLRANTIAKSSFQGTVFANKFARAGQPIGGDFDDLVEVFEQASRMAHVSKEEALLWSPAHYVDRPDLDSRRSLANVAFCRNVILDFDGGDITPDVVAALLPELRVVAHSSWSHSAKQQRFRVLIPTDGIMDVEGYRVITGAIVARLNEAGYWSAHEIATNAKLTERSGFQGSHGCDMGKLGPASLFYLPSLGIEPESAFFEDFNAQGRASLRVRDWLRNAPVPDQRQPREVHSRPVFTPLSTKLSARMARLVEALRERKVGSFSEEQQRRIDVALGEWALCDQPGRRDEGICRLGVALRAAGCTRDEALDHMIAAVATSQQAREMREKSTRWVKKLYR